MKNDIVIFVNKHYLRLILALIAFILCLISYQMNELIKKPEGSFLGESSYNPVHVVIQGDPSHVIIDGTEKPEGIPVHVETPPAPTPSQLTDPARYQSPY